MHPRKWYEMIQKTYSSLATHMMPIFFWGSKDAFRGPGFWFLGLELTNSFQAFRAPWCGWRSLKICFVVGICLLKWNMTTCLKMLKWAKSKRVHVKSWPRCFADKLRGGTSHRHIDTLHPVEPRFHAEVFSESFPSFKKRTCGFVQRDGMCGRSS